MIGETAKLLPRKRVRINRAQFTSTSSKIKPTNIKNDNSITVKPEIKPDLNPETNLETRSDVAANMPAKIEIEELLQVSNDTQITGPPNWQVFVERIREMRKLRYAPVDDMGDEWNNEVGRKLPGKLRRFELLVSLMLSSQTKDEITAAVVQRLRKTLKPDLTPEALLAVPEPELAQMLLPVGFFRRKAQYLHKTSQILLDQYDGDIPRTIKEITQLPGVGPKMGYLLLQAAWDQTEGIGVDVHVHRLAHMWGWVPKSKHPTPEKTRIELEKWLPKNLWAEMNPLLVGFGQTWCPSRSSPKLCRECHLVDLCPVAKHK